MSGTPTVSVVVCTRNRPIDLGRCLAGLAESSPPPLEVIVVDQSDSPGRGTDPPIDGYRHHVASERGLSLARNAGIALSVGDVVAFLDDDCTVEPGWAGEIATLFERHPEA